MRILLLLVALILPVGAVVCPRGTSHNGTCLLCPERTYQPLLDGISCLSCTQACPVGSPTDFSTDVFESSSSFVPNRDDLAPVDMATQFFQGAYLYMVIIVLVVTLLWCLMLEFATYDAKIKKQWYYRLFFRSQIWFELKEDTYRTKADAWLSNIWLLFLLLMCIFGAGYIITDTTARSTQSVHINTGVFYDKLGLPHNGRDFQKIGYWAGAKRELTATVTLLGIQAEDCDKMNISVASGLPAGTQPFRWSGACQATLSFPDNYALFRSYLTLKMEEKITMIPAIAVDLHNYISGRPSSSMHFSGLSRPEPTDFSQNSILDVTVLSTVHIYQKCDIAGHASFNMLVPQSETCYITDDTNVEYTVLENSLTAGSGDLSNVMAGEYPSAYVRMQFQRDTNYRVTTEQRSMSVAYSVLQVVLLILTVLTFFQLFASFLINFAMPEPKTKESK